MCKIVTPPQYHQTPDCAGEKAMRPPGSIIVFILFVTIPLLAIYFGPQLLPGLEAGKLDRQISYAFIFLTGLATGFHCIGMCGGFVLACATSHKSGYWAYALGKTLSYTLLGFGFGWLGHFFSFSAKTRISIGMAGGLLLLLLGAQTSGMFPGKRNFGLHWPKPVTRLTFGVCRGVANPFLLGGLNGFMVLCGPLQAMYVMAAGHADPWQGAAMLFIFGVGTLPIMLGFSLMASRIQNIVRHQVFRLSSALIFFFGLNTINHSLVLLGTGYDLHSIATRIAGDAQQKITATSASSSPVLQTIEIQVTRSGWQPSQFILQKGVPVQWIIHGRELNVCNKVIQVPTLNLKIELSEGLNVVQFTPRQAGNIPWSCWMGMLSGNFTIVEDATVAVKYPSNIKNSPHHPLKKLE